MNRDTEEQLVRASINSYLSILEERGLDPGIPQETIDKADLRDLRKIEHRLRDLSRTPYP